MDLTQQSRREGGGLRRLIISTFEFVCLALVVVPTAIGLIITAAVFASGKESNASVLITIGIFIATAFLAGGALTLIDIAHNTRAMAGRL